VPTQDQKTAAPGPVDGKADDTTKGPDAASLQQQGQAAVSRLATSIDGLHTLPVGTKLYVQSGSVQGKKLIVPYHIQYGGTGEVETADASHLVLTVEAVGSYMGESFDRTSELRFSLTDSGHMSMSGDIKDNKKTTAKPMSIDNVTLTILPGSTPDSIKFKDSKKNAEGSITWDAAKQLLTLNYSEGNYVVLGPNPPQK
jgi:hypothetical protein